jgi:hypothetical protein
MFASTARTPFLRERPSRAACRRAAHAVRVRRPHARDVADDLPPARIPRAARQSTRYSPRPPPSRPEPPGRNAGTVTPLRSATSTLMTSPAASTVTVTVLPGSPEALCRTLLVTSSLSRSTAVSPAGCWPSTAAANASGNRDPLGAPGDRHAFTNRPSDHDGDTPSEPPAGAQPKDRELTTGRESDPGPMHAPLAGHRQASTGPLRAIPAPGSAPIQHTCWERPETTSMNWTIPARCRTARRVRPAAPLHPEKSRIRRSNPEISPSAAAAPSPRAGSGWCPRRSG